MKITKRNGKSEELSVDKINKIVTWACEGLDANPSDIILNAKIRFKDGMKTTKIHELLVESAKDLISARKPDYQYVASKLFNFYIRKQIFGVFLDEDMPSVYDVVVTNTELGLYDENLIKKYTEEEWSQIDKLIKHSEDSKSTIASYEKMYNSYLVRNRDTKYVYETPQYAFILIAASIFDTIKEIEGYYNLLKGGWLNQPTPIMAGVRTPTKQFASCTLIDIDDDLDSIYSSAHAIGRFVSRKAGIGLFMCRIRSLCSPIRGGEAVHTGIIPFLKFEEAATKSCSQGGIREGSATVHFQIWNSEIESILVLKNNKGTDDNRVRRLDYSIQLSKLFINRMLKGEKITLFSTSECPGLYDAWGTDSFDELYIKYEKQHLEEFGKDSDKIVEGRDLLQSLVSERINTGRIYIQMIDNVNNNNAFNDKITMSNLCMSPDTLVDVKIDTELDDIELIKDLNKEGDVYVGKLTIEALDSIYKRLEQHGSGKIEVKSKNLETGEVEFNVVTASAMTNPDAELYEIEDTESGVTIKCTADHKVYTKNRGYVLAKELKEEDILDII